MATPGRLATVTSCAREAAAEPAAAADRWKVRRLSGNSFAVTRSHMNDIDSFFGECVYYPCSALHGVPVKFLGKRFQRFFYADYSVDRARFHTSIKEEGFKGYRLSTIDELNPELVFGMSWIDFEQRYSSTRSRIHFEWLDPFVVLSRFERAPLTR